MRHMVKDDSDSEQGNTPPHGPLFPIRSECLTCTFRASCCSARLSRAQVSAFTMKDQ